jgi:hypothetical protein
LHLLEEMPEKQVLEQKKIMRKHLDIHQPGTLTESRGKRTQDIHGGRDPFCESIIVILGLAERGDLLPKDGEHGLGGIAGLKPRKEGI